MTIVLCGPSQCKGFLYNVRRLQMMLRISLSLHCREDFEILTPCRKRLQEMGKRAKLVCAARFTYFTSVFDCRFRKRPDPAKDVACWATPTKLRTIGELKASKCHFQSEFSQLRFLRESGDSNFLIFSFELELLCLQHPERAHVLHNVYFKTP